MNDAVLEGGKGRWIWESSVGLAFDHGIDFSRPADGYDYYRSNLCCFGGFPKGVMMKGVLEKG